MQTEFPYLVTVPRSAARKPPTLDYPLGDGDLKPPVKRPRLQRYLWEAFGLSKRKITDSLRGTLSKPRTFLLPSPALPRRRKQRSRA
jgi:hypothetical protein